MTAPPTQFGGRNVVLKRLDDDCLLDGQLHPSIRQRLNRVRELPLTCVANLIGVEKVDGTAQLVWEHVPGHTLEALRCDAPEWGRLTREVILAVESLHSAGIVHGAIHERNVILDGAGNVKLTHISPLLYTETQDDAADVMDMLQHLVQRDAPDSDLARALGEAREGNWKLGEMYRRVSETGTEPPPPAREPVKSRTNVSAIVSAVIVAIAGVAVALIVLSYVRQ